MTKHIIVVGGGIAGASAAHTLVKRGYKVTILEKNDYIGGRIHTYDVNGASLEMGAGFMTRIYTNMLTFLQSEGMEKRLYRQQSSSGILRHGQVQMATPQTLLGNKALSWNAKLHLIPFLAKTLARWRNLNHHEFWRASKYDNRSVKDAIGNEELLEYLMQPMLNGYFYWSPEYVSEAMLLVLSKTVLIQRGTYKMHGGLQRIPEKAAEGSTVLLGRNVTEVRRNKNRSYKITTEYNGKTEVLRADGVVCATTATVVSRIFTDLSETQKAFFQSVQYSSTAVAAHFYEREHIRGDRGIGFPRHEGIELAAVTTEPSRGRLAAVKMFASGAIGSRLCKESNETIVSELTRAMKPVQSAVLADSPKPIATRIQRWPEALPLFDVGHLKFLRAFENGDIEDQKQPIVFAGDYLGGPFMEGAFTSGMQAAARLDALLRR